MKIHQIKIDFSVTEQIKRYVYVYIVESINCYLIDSGVCGSEKMIEDYLSSIGKGPSEIRGIFLTHAHPDHIGTAAYFRNKTGCKIYASEGERRWIEDIGIQFEERPIPNFFQLAGKSSRVDVEVADGDSIELENEFTVSVLATPGHSADEVSYLIGGCAFIGDTVPVKGDIPIYVNKKHTLDSLRKLWDLSVRDPFYTFYPAWDKAYTCEELRETIRGAEGLMEQLDNAVRCVQKENPQADLRQTAQLVGEKIKMPHLMQNPLFQRTVQSHMKD